MIKIVEDSEINDFVKDELQEGITQETSINDNVTEELGGMGWLWEVVNRKLQTDKSCFNCKEPIDFPKEKMQVVETSGVEKGVVAFVSFCEKCATQIHKEQEKKLKEVQKK